MGTAEPTPKFRRISGRRVAVRLMGKIVIRSFIARALRGSLVVVALAALGGCAQKPPPDPIDLASAKSIGIYSHCGAVVHRQADAWFNVGLDDHTTRAVPDWQLDAALAEAIRNGLPTSVEATDVALDVGLTTIATQLVRRDDPNALWALAIASANAKTDLYVVVFPRSSNVFWIGEQGYYRREPNAKFGFGIYTRMAERTAHAVCAAFVYDARQHKVVRRFTLYDSATMPGEAVASTWNEFTPEQLETARDTLRPLATNVGGTVATLVTQNSNLAPPSAQK